MLHFMMERPEDEKDGNREEGEIGTASRSGGFAWLATNDGGSEFLVDLDSKYWCS